MAKVTPEPKRAPKRASSNPEPPEEAPNPFTVFISALSRGIPRDDALKEAKLTREQVAQEYDTNPDFARRFGKAWELVVDAAEDAAFRRGVLGWYEPVFDKNGNQCGDVPKFDGALLQFFLKGNRGKYRGEDTGRSRGVSEETRREVLSIFEEAALSLR